MRRSSGWRRSTRGSREWWNAGSLPDSPKWKPPKRWVCPAGRPRGNGRWPGDGSIRSWVVTPAEPGRSAAMRAVVEVLELPLEARAGALAARLPDGAERAEAERLLRACERAAEGSLLDVPAA